jgi:hypothetical protein
LCLVLASHPSHPEHMPLVVRALLAWFAVSAVASPFIGTMLAAGNPDASRSTSARPVRV